MKKEERKEKKIEGIKKERKTDMCSGGSKGEDTFLLGKFDVVDVDGWIEFIWVEILEWWEIYSNEKQNEQKNTKWGILGNVNQNILITENRNSKTWDVGPCEL